MAVTWGNVDLVKHTIRVDRAVTVETVFDEGGKKLNRKTVVAQPKTLASYRTIHISSAVVATLSELRDELASKNENLTAPDMPVFTNKQGNGYTYGGFRANFRRFLKRAGLEDYGITLHMFRHTFATILLENEVNPRIVQNILGHSDISTTLGIYSHVVEQVYENVADTMDGVYAETLAGTYEPKAARRFDNKSDNKTYGKAG